MPCTSFAHALCARGIDACRVTNPQGVCSGESPARAHPKKAILDITFFPFISLIPSEREIETKYRHGRNENEKRRERKQAFSSGVFFVFPNALHPAGGIYAAHPMAIFILYCFTGTQVA